MRELAIALLDDDQGISLKAWRMLETLLDCGDDDNQDIIDAVKIADSRVYLPSNFGKY